MHKNRDACWLMLTLLGTALLGPRLGSWEWNRAEHFRQCRSNCQQLATALEMYASDYGGRYPARMEQLLGRYVRDLPRCPTTGTDPYSLSYHCTAGPDSFSFGCVGRHHGPPPQNERCHCVEADYSQGYPWYDADYGGFHERP